jgi:hypothetical protein
MPCRRKKATYKNKRQAKIHGAITYGSKRHREYKTKKGWRTSKK